MNSTHGLSRSQEYRIWGGMIQRCCNPKHGDYCWYGLRGIKVCQRWADDFMAFYADMGPRPTASHSLERIDNDGNYEPGNVKWIPRVEQSRNRRNNRWIEFNGQVKTTAQWAEETGIHPHTLKSRLDILGWPIEDVLTRKVR